MATIPSAGTTLGISTTLQATYDAAGFGALTYTLIGCLGSIPDANGAYDVSTFDCIDTGTELKEPSIFRAGSGTFNVAMDDADAGHLALEGAIGSKIAVAITLTNGTIYYRNAVLTSFMPSNIQVGNLVEAEVTFEFFNGPSVKV